jgi:hypothetical protein
MMDIMVESVQKIEELVEHSGCSDAGVLLDVDPDAAICQFERGACMTASFGGKSAEFATDDPIRARTKISFMFGAPLDTPPARGAAGAIVNIVLGFLCMIRVLHACPASCHTACRNQLAAEIAGRLVSCTGLPGNSVTGLSHAVTGNIDEAEVILINGEGMIDEGTGDLIQRHTGSKRIVCLGPSTAGIARLHGIEHWCPFGRS